MRLIDADLMATDESEAYLNAQSVITDNATKIVNEVVHRKIQMLIADTPTVDAVPVVRCKDCMFSREWKKHDHLVIAGRCAFLIGENQYVVPDGYCNLAMKKVEEGSGAE